MNKLLIIWVSLLAITFAAITFDTSVRCSCVELTAKSDCETLDDYCKWNTTCQEIEDVPFSCSNYTQTECTKEKTYYDCTWENSQCVDYEYSCSDFKSKNDCLCYWNKNNECESFSSCDNYDKDNCPTNSQTCTTRNNVCEEIICSNYKTKVDCYGQDSETTRCAWSNSNECQSLTKDYICTDLDDFQDLCESKNCVYASNECTFKTCAHKKDKYDCYYAQTSKYEAIACIWQNETCAEAVDTKNFTAENCTSSRLGYNYRWNKETSACQECDDLISRLPDHAVILSVFVALALNA